MTATRETIGCFEALGMAEQRMVVCDSQFAATDWLVPISDAAWKTDGPVLRIPWPGLKGSSGWTLEVVGDYMNFDSGGGAGSQFLCFDLSIDGSSSYVYSTIIGSANGIRIDGGTLTGDDTTPGWFKITIDISGVGSATGGQQHILDILGMSYTSGNTLIATTTTRARTTLIDATENRTIQVVYKLQSSTNHTKLQPRSWSFRPKLLRSG